jgi:hypothetical protein
MKKKLAYGQSELVFDLRSDETGLSTAREYLRVSPANFITTNNGKKLYGFIVQRYLGGCDRILLHTDSKTTEECILHMIERAKKVKAVKFMLNNITIVNTYSNADKTRERIKQAYVQAGLLGIKCNLYFALSKLSSVIKTTNTGQVASDGKKEQLVVISNKQGPYTQQIWTAYNDIGTDTTKVWMDDFTIDMMKEFEGNKIILAPVSDGDYKKVNRIVAESGYSGSAAFFECTRVDLVPDIIESIKLETVKSLASAVALNAKGYDGMSKSVPYEPLCAAIAQVNWEDLINAGVLTPVCAE